MRNGVPRVVSMVAVLLAACGGGEARLQALQIIPPVTSVTEHLTAGVRAEAVYDDGSLRDVTAEAAWSSADAAVATVQAGLVRAGPPGGTYLSAAWGGLTAAARVEVLPAVLLSLRLVVEQAALPAGVTTHLTALGTFSDGSERDVTALVTWGDDHDDDDPVLLDVEGHCHGEVPAEVTVRATLGGVTAELQLEVLEAAPTSLTLAGLEAPVPVGGHAHLTLLAPMTDGSVRDVTAQAEIVVADGAVAALGEDGEVVALAAGATEVRASWRGQAATATLRTVQAALVAIAIQPPEELPEQGELAWFRASGRYTDGAVRDLTAAVTWSTTDPAVALAYPWLGAGAVFARLPGSVTVVATDPASGVEGRFLLVIERDD